MMTTIHTRHLKIHVQTVNNTTVRQYCIQFPLFFPTHTVLTLSPRPFPSHHFTTHINFSNKVSFLPPSLHFTSLHFISLHYTFRWFSLHFTSFHFTNLLEDFHFALLHFTTLLDDFQHTLSSFNSPRLSLMSFCRRYISLIPSLRHLNHSSLRPYTAGPAFATERVPYTPYCPACPCQWATTCWNCTNWGVSKTAHVFRFAFCVTKNVNTQ